MVVPLPLPLPLPGDLTSLEGDWTIVLVVLVSEDGWVDWLEVGFFVWLWVSLSLPVSDLSCLENWKQLDGFLVAVHSLYDISANRMYTASA